MQNAYKVGVFLLALSALSVARAQNPDPAAQQSSIAQATSQEAPIVRGNPGGSRVRGVQSFDSQPIPGVFVRSDVSNGVQTVSSSGSNTEFRVVQGKANVTVHHPADHAQIFVDLPGGQVSLLKDGLYTFNAATNTVRVLHGEAEARNNSTSNDAKGTKVKETQQLAFFGDAKLRAVNAYPYELTADLMPGGDRGRGDGEGPYRSGFYGEYAGAYGYPYGYGFDYGYGLYPYGYGYPFGFGFGYYGGFGGYRGGFGGFRGGGFRR